MNEKLFFPFTSLRWQGPDRAVVEYPKYFVGCDPCEPDIAYRFRVAAPGYQTNSLPEKPMKKYKLIKRYPGSPLVGSEVRSRFGGYRLANAAGVSLRIFDSSEIENHPEFWQIITEINGVIMFTAEPGAVYHFTFEGSKEEFMKHVRRFNDKAENGCGTARPVTQK